jgi:hypothetical protein
MLPFDLEVDAAVGRLDLGLGTPATDLAITTRGTAQALDLLLAEAKLGPGKLQAHYRVEAAAGATDIVFRLGAQDIDLTDLFGRPGGGNELPKDVRVAVDLTGRGSDLHAFLGSADGPIAISTGPAVLDETFVNLLGKSLFTAGKARSTAFVIDGKHVVVGGGGALELATGRIDVMLLPTAKEATLAPLVAPVHLAGTITDPQVMSDAGDLLNSAGHLLLGIVDPLSLATPILHPDRSGDMPCRDPRAFAGGQPNPVERVGQGAVDVMEGVGHGIGAALERLGKGASGLLDDLTGR